MAAVPLFAAASSNSSWPSSVPSIAAFTEAPLGSAAQDSCSFKPSVTGASSSVACKTSAASIIASPKCTEVTDWVCSGLSASALRMGLARLVVAGLVCSQSRTAFAKAEAAKEVRKVH